MINAMIDDEFMNLLQEEIILKTAETVLSQENRADTDMSVVIQSDEQLKELNKTYLGIDAPTDVLSFPAEELDPDTNRIYLGDVIISYQRAKEQAEAANELIDEEIQLLVVHGTLHLLGYDHSSLDEKAKMWKAQQTALSTLGCKITRLPE
jgi:probable rRNA maturation factor